MNEEKKMKDFKEFFVIPKAELASLIKVLGEVPNKYFDGVYMLTPFLAQLKSVDAFINEESQQAPALGEVEKASE